MHSIWPQQNNYLDNFYVILEIPIFLSDILSLIITCKQYLEFQVSRWSGTVTESILIVGIPEVMKIHSSRSVNLLDQEC
jgi:hypothetical protein